MECEYVAAAVQLDIGYSSIVAGVVVESDVCGHESQQFEGTVAVGTRGAHKSVRADHRPQCAVREPPRLVRVPDRSVVDGCESQQYGRYDPVVAGRYVRSDEGRSEQQSIHGSASIITGSVDRSGVVEGRGQQFAGQCAE